MPSHIGQEKQSGYIIIAIIVLAGIAAACFLYFARTIRQSRELSVIHHRTLLAEAYSTELLEFFRSLSSTQLNEYLKGGSATLLYPLCAHVNILDRAKDPPQILNPDPLAELGPSFFSSPDPKKVMNRWYQVQVVDLLTLEPKAFVCGTLTPYNFLTNANDRYMVTIGVSWVPSGKTLNEPERIVMSTILPK